MADELLPTDCDDDDGKNQGDCPADQPCSQKCADACHKINLSGHYSGILVGDFMFDNCQF